MPTTRPTHSIERPPEATRRARRRLAREVAVGAPVAALLWFALIRLFVGVWSFWFPALILALSAVIALSLCGPPLLAGPVERFWRGLVGAIDWVVTRVVCALLFYGLFTPVALVRRLLRKPLLDGDPSPAKDSYWREVPPEASDRRRYLRQF